MTNAGRNFCVYVGVSVWMCTNKVTTDMALENEM